MRNNDPKHIEVTPGPNKPDIEPPPQAVPGTPPIPTHPEPPTEPEPVAPEIK
jgi:hypothetical protein